MSPALFLPGLIFPGTQVMRCKNKLIETRNVIDVNLNVIDVINLVQIVLVD